MFWFLHYAVKTLIAVAIAGLLWFAYDNRHLLSPAQDWVNTLERADLERLEVLGTNTARVVRVNSGDTLTVGEKRSDRLEFRIAGVVAPPYNRHRHTPSWKSYEDSRRQLESLVRSNEVSVAYTFLVPRAGGVGGVYLNGTNVAISLLESGMAVVHDPSLKSLPLTDQVLLLAAEKRAREDKRGIWNDPAMLGVLRGGSGKK